MSTLKADTIVASDGSSPVTLTKQSAAKAWNSTDSGAIDDSFNVASMTDNGTGDYTTSFSNSMSNALYAQTNHFFFEQITPSWGYISQNADRVAGSVRNWGRRNASGTLGDSHGCVAINGDLA